MYLFIVKIDYIIASADTQSIIILSIVRDKNET